MSQRIEFEPDFDEDVDFDADDELDEEFDATTSPRFEALRERGREMLSGVKERGRERVAQAAERGKQQIAGRLEGGATYLRTTDVDVMRDDFSAAVRRNPLLATGLALGAGYVIGRVVPLPSLRKKGGIGGQISRALVGSLAALVVSHLRNDAVPPEPARSPAARRSPARKRTRTR